MEKYSMETLEEKIQKTVLTKTDRKIADYLLDHKDTISFKTVSEVASQIGTSDTSVIRFLRSLGYAGFSEFKKELSRQVVRKLQETRETLSPGEKYLKTSELLKRNDVVSEVIRKSIENIQDTFTNVDSALLTEVADILVKAKRKYIAGFRGSSSCAAYMYRKMVVFLPDVVCLDKAESCTLEQMIDIKRSDCLLIYSFTRYTKINYTLMEMAHEVGAKIILVTDKITSPLAAKADYVISTKVEGAGLTYSYVVPLCVSEILLLLISNKMKLRDKERLNRLDKYINEQEMY